MLGPIPESLEIWRPIKIAMQEIWFTLYEYVVLRHKQKFQKQVYLSLKNAELQRRDYNRWKT